MYNLNFSTQLSDNWYLMPMDVESDSASDRFFSLSKDTLPAPANIAEDWTLLPNSPDLIYPEYQGNALKNWLLWSFHTQVFGSDAHRMGEVENGLAISYYVQRSLEIAQKYVKILPPEFVKIPYDGDIYLSGQLFGAYSHPQSIESESFDPDKRTAIIFSGSFFPHQVFTPAIAEGYRQAGIQVLTFDYMGFGENMYEESPSPQNMFKSAEVALNYLIEKKVSPENIIIHGYSLGGFPAAKLAAQYGTDLVLDRVSISTKTIVRKALSNMLPSVVNGIAVEAIAAVVAYAAPFWLEDALPKVKGKVFIAQEIDWQSDGVLGLIQRLQECHALDCKLLKFATTQEGHLTTPYNTWTIKAHLLAEKLGERTYNGDRDQEVRKQWLAYLHMANCDR
jgi:hypothetical protein